MKEYTTEELEAEIQRRKLISANPLEPYPLHLVDWSSVYQQAVEYVNGRIAGTSNEEWDGIHYMFEEVIQAVYGRGIFKVLNKL